MVRSPVVCSERKQPACQTAMSDRATSAKPAWRHRQRGSASVPDLGETYAMLPPRTTASAACCVVATWCVRATPAAGAASAPRRPLRTAVWAMVGAMLCVLGAVQPAWAQPKPQDSLAAYRTVDEWVRAWAVEPPAAGGGEVAGGPQNAARAGAVCVTLRMGGRVVGRGVSDGAADGLRAALASATAAALRDAEPRLGVPNDALRETNLRTLAPQIAISLELAGESIPIEPATWEDAERTLAPGLDGVVARLAAAAGGQGGPGASAPAETVFPSMMMATGTLPHRALSGAVARAIGAGGAAAALEEPVKIRAEHGVRMARFRVSHVAQPRAGVEPVFLIRGSRPLPPSHVMTGAEINQMTARLAEHLLARVRNAESAKDALSPTQIALAIAALENAAPLLGTLPIAADIRAQAPAIAARLARRIKASTAADDRTAVLVLTRVYAGRARLNAEDAAALAAIAPAPDGTESERAEMLKVTPPVGALRAYALLGVPFAPRTDTLDPAAEAAAEILRTGLIQTPAGARAALMPWLAMAAVDAGMQRAQPRPDFGVALREVRDQMWSHQLDVTTAGPDRLDMVGGITFTLGKRDAGDTLPDWQSARAVAAAGAMLRDASITEPGERGREVVRLMSAARFLRGLQVDEAAMWMEEDPAALGAIRAAPWDRARPIDAQSLTLIALVELQRGLAVLTQALDARGVDGR